MIRLTVKGKDYNPTSAPSSFMEIWKTTDDPDSQETFKNTLLSNLEQLSFKGLLKYIFLVYYK